MDGSSCNLLDHVQEGGRYSTRQEADLAMRSVLEVLGSHLVGGDDRTDLADRLPQQYGRWVREAAPANEPLRPSGFVDTVAADAGISRQDACRAVTAVLPPAIADVADEGLLQRLLTQLPPRATPACSVGRPPPRDGTRSRGAGPAAWVPQVIRRRRIRTDRWGGPLEPWPTSRPSLGQPLRG